MVGNPGKGREKNIRMVALGSQGRVNLITRVTIPLCRQSDVNNVG
jgi:hypothetical protein